MGSKIAWSTKMMSCKTKYHHFWMVYMWHVLPQHVQGWRPKITTQHRGYFPKSNLLPVYSFMYTSVWHLTTNHRIKRVTLQMIFLVKSYSLLMADYTETIYTVSLHKY